MTLPREDRWMTADERDTVTCPADHKHDGSGYCYHAHKCRCEPCVSRAYNYQEQRRRQIAYGRWKGLTDATDVREHLKRLVASGMGCRRISDLSGLVDNNVRAILSGDIKKVAASTRTRLLAIEPGNVAHGAFIDSRGTRRRIQALVAVGWTNDALGHLLGVSPSNVYRLFTRPHVTRRTADRVAEVYERIWNQPPTGAPVGIARAKKRAAKYGWVPPLAWDDIDLDDAPPSVEVTPLAERFDSDVVEDALAGHNPVMSPPERREVVTQLNNAYWSSTRIAAWIGCNPKTVERIRAELGLVVPHQNEIRDAA